MRMVMGTALLALVYCLALASANPWDIGLGAVFGFTILCIFRTFLFLEPTTSPRYVLTRAIHFPALVAVTTVDIVRGTIDVARIVLSPKIVSRGGLVEIPDGGRTTSGVIVSGLINTLSPGSVLIDIDPESLDWTIHVVDASHPEEIVAHQQSFYERFQRPIWP
jgi:multicomponent Na+:H+ antiporter subunit E